MEQTATPGAHSLSPRLILASASPRRRDLLGYLGVSFDVMATDAEEGDESPPPPIAQALPPVAVPPANHPTLLAWRKAHAAAAIASDAVVIGADTIVVLDEQVLNKPHDPNHARAMLARLAGRTHTVYTGLCIVQPIREQPTSTIDSKGREDAVWVEVGSQRLSLAVVASQVEMNPQTPAAIANYVATGEPMDKAGAYGIQGMGGKLVRAVYGSYTAVVGFPLPMVQMLLTAAGVPDVRDPAEAYQHWLQVQGKEPLPCPPTHP